MKNEKMKQWGQVHELEGHSGKVMALVIFRKELYSGCSDGFIVVFFFFDLNFRKNYEG